jgi:hypothetical protein
MYYTLFNILDFNFMQLCTIISYCLFMQSMRWPRLFWVSACAPLASVIISTLVVFLFKAQNHGISIVRAKNTEKYFSYLLLVFTTR